MKEENVVYDKTNKSKKGIVLITALIIVVVGLGLAGVGVFLLSKPKAVFQESYNYLTKSFKSLGLTTNDNLDILDKDKVKVENKINVNLNQSLGLGITNLDLNMQVMSDKVNNTSKIYLDSKLENQDLLEFVSYLKDNKMYLTITDIFDKYYYTDIDTSSTTEYLTTNDIELLIDIVKNSLKKVITDEKFEKEKTVTSVDGLEENVTKLTLKVDDKLLSDVVVEVINRLKADDKALEVLVKVLEVTKEELIKTLDDILTEVKETTGETLFTYNIYYKNINDIKKLEILSGTTILTYSANNGNYRFKVIDDDKKVEEISLLIEEKDKNYNITLNIFDFNATGKLKRNKNNYNLILDMVDNKDNKLGTLVIDYLYTSDVQDKLVINYRNNDTDMIKLTVDSKIIFNENVVFPDMSGAKSIDNMTEEEINIIMTNLQNHKIIGPFISMLMQLGNNGLLGNESQDLYSDSTTLDIYNY